MFDLGEYKLDDGAHIPGVSGCVMCGLRRCCNMPEFPPHGKMRRKVCFVAGSPSGDEDLTGHALISNGGMFLREVLRRRGWSLDDDCLSVYACACRAKDPTAKHTAACRNRLLSVIDQHDPNVIVPMGPVAVEGVLGGVWTKDLRDEHLWRGLRIPWRGRWVCPVYDHMETRRRGIERDPAMMTIFANDVNTVLDIHETRPKDVRIDPVILSESQAARKIAEMLERVDRPVAVDYETPSLKPETPGYAIYAAGLSNEPGVGYGFLMTERLRIELKRLLESPVPKVAHNVKFEHRWARSSLGADTGPWLMDTMLCAHQEDNRKGYSGLKFQLFCKYGLPDYSVTVDSYLKSDKRSKVLLGSNAQNRVTQAPVRDLLKYVATDAAGTLLLANDFRKAIR